MIGGLLDRYVRMTVLGSYAACLLFLILLFILLDLLLNIGDYIDVTQPLEGEGAREPLSLFGLMSALGMYYVVWIPFIFVTLSPFVSVIAGMFSVSRLMGANEVVPMLFTGRSVMRVLRPVLVMGVLSAIATALCWEFAIPPLASRLNKLRDVLQAKEVELELENIIVRLRDDDTSHTLFCSKYFPDRLRMQEVSMVLEEKGAGASLVLAHAADWNPEEEDWDLVAGEHRTQERATRRARLGMKGLTPELLWRTSKEGRDSVELSYSDLIDLQSLRPGQVDYVLAFHKHITFPLANIVLLLLALPFAIRFEQGNRIERVLFAILICGLYLVTDLTCQNLGHSTLHPILAAWLPTILFGSVGIAFFTGIRT